MGLALSTEHRLCAAVVAFPLNVSLAHFTWLHPIITVSHIVFYKRFL